MCLDDWDPDNWGSAVVNLLYFSKLYIGGLAEHMRIKFGCKQEKKTDGACIHT